MAPTQITDHADQAVNRLPNPLRGQPKLEALVRALVGPIQHVEDALWQLLTERTIDIATGVTLDSIGRLVGEPPTGLDIETYRRHIKARIRANRSRGQVEDLIKIVRLILNDPAAGVQMERQTINTIVVRILERVTDDDLANTLIRFLLLATSAEGRVLLETLTALEDDTFTLAIAAFSTGALSIGNTTIAVGSTAGFPDTGSVDIDVGLATAETKAYTGKTTTSFIGVTALTQNHASGCCVQLSGAPGKGLGDSTNAVTGGMLASVREEVV